MQVLMLYWSNNRVIGFNFLQVHPSAEATKLAIGQCGTIKRFMESNCQSWRSAVAPGGGVNASRRANSTSLSLTAAIARPPTENISLIHRCHRPASCQKRPP